MIPDLILARSLRALAIGAKQFVVQEARGDNGIFRLQCFVVYIIYDSWQVVSKSGAEITTFFPAFICRCFFFDV